MEDFLAEHAGELVVGLVLGMFGWAFRGWSQTLSSSTKQIMLEMKAYWTSFNQYRVDVEKRLSRLETHMEELSRLCEDNRRRHDRTRNDKT